MLLSDRTVRELLQSGDVCITPAPNDEQIQPVSIDLRLGVSYVLQGPHHDERTSTSFTLIRPGEFLLANTREHVRLPAHIAGIVHGKSTWARRGLMVEAAGLVDPGFEGTITLELKNLGHRPLPLTAGIPICQMMFFAVDVAVLRPYGSAGLDSHYQGQQDAEPAR